MHRRMCGLWVVAAMSVLVFGLSGPVSGATSQSSTTAVTLNIAEAIEVVSWPEATITLSSVAVPGQPVVSGALRFTVKCNTNWGIQVKSDDAEGRLREFTVSTSSYVTDGRASQRALEWSLDSGGQWTALSATPVNLATGLAPTGEAGTTVSMYVRYVPGFNDLPLTGDHVYRALLTYTAAVGY